MIRKRFDYLKRVYQAYLSGEDSQLTFWHGAPSMNPEMDPGRLGQYYMPFLKKAAYTAHLDDQGIPLLDYHGKIGLQYNPIAIAQYGLGNFNLYQRTGQDGYRSKFMLSADWLKDNLEENKQGVPVWMHNFDFEYQEVLRAPWYSGLAQGQGISVLVRAYQITQDEDYLEAAENAFVSMERSTAEGGVTAQDEKDNLWIEEYIVDPPSHILNGFIWALWGVYDYYLVNSHINAKNLFDQGVKTIRENLHRYDLGYWSLYDLSSNTLKMIASPFYHQLHVVQLEVMYKITGEQIFKKCADRWAFYQERPGNRWRATIQKVIFKVFYY